MWRFQAAIQVVQDAAASTVGMEHWAQSLHMAIPGALQTCPTSFKELSAVKELIPHPSVVLQVCTRIEAKARGDLAVREPY